MDRSSAEPCQNNAPLLPCSPPWSAPWPRPPGIKRPTSARSPLSSRPFASQRGALDLPPSARGFGPASGRGSIAPAFDPADRSPAARASTSSPPKSERTSSSMKRPTAASCISPPRPPSASCCFWKSLPKGPAAVRCSIAIGPHPDELSRRRRGPGNPRHAAQRRVVRRQRRRLRPAQRHGRR